MHIVCYFLQLVKNNSASDNPGTNKGIPNPGKNIHGLITSAPILNSTSTYSAIGINPINVMNMYLVPLNFVKKRKMYVTANNRKTIRNLPPNEGIPYPKFTNARNRRMKLNKFF